MAIFPLQRAGWLPPCEHNGNIPFYKEPGDAQPCDNNENIPFYKERGDYHLVKIMAIFPSTKLRLLELPVINIPFYKERRDHDSGDTI